MAHYLSFIGRHKVGSEDLFHKLKAKAKKAKKRESNKREPYPKFLIVCEDTVSGFHYLNNAVKHFKISSANFSIIGLGQSPISLVNHAEKKYKQELDSHRPEFDKVFCVFDRDTHTSYYGAISKISAINKKIKNQPPVFEAITSDPCFELWLILHFRYTTKSYSASQKKSAAAHVFDDLVKELPSYKKCSKDCFENTINNLSDAIQNSEKLTEYCKKHSTDSPKTNMHKLMLFMQNLTK